MLFDNHIMRGRVLRRAIGITILIFLIAGVAGAQSSGGGDIEIIGAVSDESMRIYSWDAQNFPGFWYDLKDNKSTETLTIGAFKDERSIETENLWYNTTITPIQFKVSHEKGGLVEYGIEADGITIKSTGGGYYDVVGWMGEKYVGINGKNNKLAKLVMEQDTSDKKTLTVGETWEIGGGYILTAQEIDARSYPRRARLVLSKDGAKLDDKVINASSTSYETGTQGVYTYYKNISSEFNVPIFVTYIDSVFSGATQDMVQLKYTWLISHQNVTEIKESDIIGVFRVDSTNPLKLKSNSSITLSRGTTVNITDHLKFKVADNSVLGFYPFFLKPAQDRYEVRGTVANATALYSTGSGVSWNYRNFAGIWYDLDDGKSTETLQINAFNSPMYIDKGQLRYNTSMAHVQFKVNKEKNRLVEYGLNESNGYMPTGTGGGYYNSIGWFGEKYVAINGWNNKFSRLVLEHAASDKKVLGVGETWDMGNGYTLKAQAINANSRQVRLVLSKDGVVLEDKVIEAASVSGTGTQGVYTYNQSVGGESNVPIFVTYIDSVFSGAPDTVQLKYTWLIDNRIIEVKSGDLIGIFKVEMETPTLLLISDSSVSLAKDSTVTLAGNLMFRVADTYYDDVRFYPFVTKTLNVIPPEAGIILPTNNASFLKGELIELSGYAIAGTLPYYNYSWISNIDGIIGNTTRILTFSLSPGTHNITLNVRDANGLTNSTSTRILVYPVTTANISGELDAMKWNATNFQGFWRDPITGLQTETLQINAFNSLRDIGKGQLWYNTSLAPVMYMVHKWKGRNVEYGIAADGRTIQSTGAGYYDIVGWFGRKYVGINAKNNKLSKILLEQSPSEEKTLAVGETWQMGDGFSLTLQSIDWRSVPRLALLTLSKDAKVLDDKVIEEASPSGIGTQGVYTYYADIGGESNVPMFVTYLDNISTNSVRLKYTWLISNNIIEIRAGDKIGLLKVDMENPLKLISDSSIIFSQGTTIGIADGLRFRVNNTPELHYYPEMTVANITGDDSAPSSLYTEINYGDAYSNSASVILILSSINAEEMSFSNDSLSWSPWEPFASEKAWKLINGDGLKTVHFKARNSAGESTPVNDTIILDTTIPLVNITSPANGSFLRIPKIDFKGNATDSNGIKTGCIGQESGGAGSSMGCGGLGNILTSIAFSHRLTLQEGRNTINIIYVDVAGNPGSAIVNVTLDSIQPDVANLSLSTSTPGINQSVNITVKINDTYLNTSGVSVLVKSPSGFMNTLPMTELGGGRYYRNFTNTSEYGRYDITILASDIAGNTNNTEKTWFVTTMLPYVNNSVNTTANNVTEIDAREKANTTLLLFTSNNTTGGAINITLSSSIPPEINQTFSLTPLGKYIKINASEDLKNNLTSGWFIINLFYTNIELNGLDENSLKLSWYNETSKSWENLASGSPTWVHAAGVVTTNINGFAGYVWANISHLSTFGIVGSYPAASQQVSSNGGSGGGGGGGGSSGENYTNIEATEKYDMQISKDALTSYRFTHAKNPIMFVNITGNTSLGMITASLEVLKNTSTLVKVSPEGLVYMNANIWVGTSGFATPKNIKDAFVKFRVDNAWMSANGVSPSDIVLMKWDGKSWISLKTTVLSKDDTNSYFEGWTNSFSPFAIVAVKADEQKSTVTTPVLTGTPEVTATGSPVTTKKSPGFGIVLALTGLTAVVLRKRRW